MKCRYVFRIKGFVKLGEVFPIKYKDFEFEFYKSESGLFDEIWVAVPVPDRKDWPSITSIDNGPIKANIRITNPSREAVVDILRFIEGTLSFFGINAIDFEEPEIIWIPESEEEKRELSVNSFSSAKADIDPNSLPELKLGIIAQTIYSFEDAWQLEPQLNFFRRGFIAVQEERFIEAIWNLYFYLESTFGNGKTKNDAVKQEFLSSKPLMEAVKEARDEFDLSSHRRKLAIYARFDSHYKGKSEEQIIDTIVNLRGFLHHHNAKRKDIWHPSDKWGYAADAYLLLDIAHRLAFAEILSHVLSEKNKKRFLDTLQEYLKGKGKSQ